MALHRMLPIILKTHGSLVIIQPVRCVQDNDGALIGEAIQQLVLVAHNIKDLLPTSSNPKANTFASKCIGSLAIFVTLSFMLFSPPQN